MENKNMMLIVGLVILALAGIGGFILWSGNQQQAALDAKRQEEMKAQAEKVRVEQENAMEEQKKAMEDAKNQMEKLGQNVVDQAGQLVGSTSPGSTGGTSPSSMKAGDKVTAKVVEVPLAVVDAKVVNQTGTAKLWEENGKVKVSVTMTPAMTTPQPVHIHTGTCPGVGAIVYPLKDVVNGKSETELATTMADLTKKVPLALNVHKSAAEAKVYTACGAVKL